MRRARARRRIATVHPDLLVLVFGFWVAQTFLWAGATLVVPFVPALGHSLLYTIEISHWALVLSCATAATATGSLIATRHVQHEEEQRVDDA